MDQSHTFHPASPLLDHCPPTLPRAAYLDDGWHRNELDRIWSRHWLYAGRDNDLPPMTLRRFDVAGQSLILVKDTAGAVQAFYNTCRHRGAELCAAAEQKLNARLISCPYHQWSYDFDGRLVRTPFVVATPDFDRSAHSLFSVPVKRWNGFLFVSLATDPPEFDAAPDLGVKALDHWPMADLVTGHRHVARIACNWKIFWENYNECLHCPGIHPDLCAMVPVYREGVMAPEERADWTPATPGPGHHLRPGARTWTVDGQPCGPEFEGLSPAERAAAHTFVTLLPTMYIVAHVDYVRAVSLKPLGPEVTELTAEWLFPQATVKAPGFDLANVVNFAKTVMREDQAAVEMNQRGLRNRVYTRGTLVPQEYAVHQFQAWVQRQLTS